MEKKFLLLFGIFLLFISIFLSFVTGTTSGSVYSVGSSVTSVQGGNASGSVFEARTYLTSNTGGNANSSIYSGIIGFFGKFKIAALAPPTLSIISPKNETYLDKKSVPLNYSVTNAESVWYSLDSEENITITSPTYFTTNKGEHTLYLYSNNSGGVIVSQSVNFSVDPDKLIIKDNKLEGNKKGDSTNFTIYSYEEMQNLSGVVLEQTDKGKIHFNQNINLTDDSTPTDNQIDIDSFINISANRIEINSTALPNFNKSATLSFYGLTFTNPRILRDGNVCPSTICTEEGYSGGILKFNVTGFSIYSSEETPTEVTSTTPPVSGSSGGNSGSGSGEVIIHTANSFSIDTEQIKVSLNPGSIITEKIVITNNLDKKISINLKESKLEKFLILNDTEIELNPKESREISLDILAREDVIPNLYLGKLTLNADSVQKEILFVIEVESKGALFDTSINVLDLYLKVYPGQSVVGEIKLYNLGIIKKADVDLEYIIENEETGEVITTKKETLAVETQVSFIKEIKIPSDAKIGKYVFYVKSTYNGKISSASAEFNVINSFWKFITPSSFTQILIILIGIAILIFLQKILKTVFSNKKGFIKTNRKIKNLKLVPLTRKSIPIGAINVRGERYLKIKPESSKTKSSKLSGLRNFLRNLWNKKYLKNSTQGLINKKVYSDMGDYIGIVSGVVFGEGKIQSLKIRPDKKYNLGPGIIIDYKHTRDIGEVVIINGNILKK